MFKNNLLLLVLTLLSVQLHAADGIIEGLETAGKVIQAAKPVVDAVGPVLKDGAEAVGKGIADVVHKKTKERVAALEAALPECVQKKDFDDSQKAQEEEIGRLRAKIPTERHPHGFVQEDPNDAVVTESRLKEVTAPLQTDIQDLKTSMGSCVTQQQLTDATGAFIKENPQNQIVRENRLQSYVQNQFNGAQESQQVVRHNQMQDYVQGQLNDVVKEDPKNPVVRQNEINDVVRKHELNGYITRDDINNRVKYAVGQCALGFSSYRLSWMTESLLRSAGMENKYVDLKDVSVPMTTFMTSFAARVGKAIYNDRMIEPQMLAEKSLLDTASSAIVIALKNIIFDEQMHAYWDKKSENQKAALYGLAVIPVSLIVDQFAHQ